MVTWTALASGSGTVQLRVLVGEELSGTSVPVEAGFVDDAGNTARVSEVLTVR